MKSTIYTIMLLISLPVIARANIGLPVENGVITSGVGLRVDPFGSGKWGWWGAGFMLIMMVPMMILVL